MELSLRVTARSTYQLAFTLWSVCEYIIGRRIVPLTNGGDSGKTAAATIDDSDPNVMAVKCIDNNCKRIQKRKKRKLRTAQRPPPTAFCVCVFTRLFSVERNWMNECNVYLNSEFVCPQNCVRRAVIWLCDDTTNKQINILMLSVWSYIRSVSLSIICSQFPFVHLFSCFSISVDSREEVTGAGVG